MRNARSLELNNCEDDVLSDKQPEEKLIKSNLIEVSHPEPDRLWGEYGDFRLVGHGKVTNPNTCGRHATLKGCLHFVYSGGEAERRSEATEQSEAPVTVYKV